MAARLRVAVVESAQYDAAVLTGRITATATGIRSVGADELRDPVGEHEVGFDSGGDEILIEHRARTRRGFAMGAVLAAEWVVERTGFFTFDQVVDDLTRD